MDDVAEKYYISALESTQAINHFEEVEIRNPRTIILELQICHNLGSMSLICHFLTTLEMYLDHNDLEKSYEFTEYAINEVEEKYLSLVEDWEEDEINMFLLFLLRTYELFSAILNEKGEFDLAFEFYERGYTYLKDFSGVPYDLNTAIFYCSSYAQALKSDKKYKKAFKVQKQLFKYLKTAYEEGDVDESTKWLDASFQIHKVYLDIADTLVHLKKWNKAEKQYLNAIKYAKKYLKKNDIQIGLCYSHYASFLMTNYNHFDYIDFEKIVGLYKKSLRIFRKSKSTLKEENIDIRLFEKLLEQVEILKDSTVDNFIAMKKRDKKTMAKKFGMSMVEFLDFLKEINLKKERENDEL